MSLALLPFSVPTMKGDRGMHVQLRTIGSQSKSLRFVKVWQDIFQKLSKYCSVDFNNLTVIQVMNSYKYSDNSRHSFFSLVSFEILVWRPAFSWIFLLFPDILLDLSLITEATRELDTSGFFGPLLGRCLKFYCRVF